MKIKTPKFYYKDGTTSSIYDNSSMLHRTDGPAVEWTDGENHWYIDGWYCTEEEFKQLIREIGQLPLALRLIDPREWVRNYEK